METATQQLNTFLRLAYNAFDDKQAVEVDPDELAMQVIKKLDPKDKAPALVSVAAIFHLKQLARAICARRQVEKERHAEMGQGELFELQDRYPARRVRDEEDGSYRDVYVLRCKLSFDERMRNVDRLSRESAAKQFHSDALRAETFLLVRDGKLDIPPTWRGLIDEGGGTSAAQ